MQRSHMCAPNLGHKNAHMCAQVRVFQSTHRCALSTTWTYPVFASFFKNAHLCDLFLKTDSPWFVLPAHTMLTKTTCFESPSIFEPVYVLHTPRTCWMTLLHFVQTFLLFVHMVRTDTHLALVCVCVCVGVVISASDFVE